MTLPQAHTASPSLLALVDAVAREHFGQRDLQGAALARAVARSSAIYTAERERIPELAADGDALCARLRFFLPRDLPKITAPLHELARVRALPRAGSLRVLDLGAGLGATALGAAMVLSELPGVTALHVDAVDSDGVALGIARTLFERWARTVGVQASFRAHVQALGDAAPSGVEGGYDLILLGFVLNELGQGAQDDGARHAALLSRLARHLSADGALIVLEPALRAQSRALQAARGRLLAAGGPPYVFAPCLHAGPCPLLERERDWCHERLPLALPEPLATIARAAGLRDADLSYSYMTLCAQRRSLAELAAEGASVPLRVVTSPLRSKGKLELGVCTRGPVRRLRLLDRHARANNAALAQAGRGSVLRLQGPTELRTDALLVTDQVAVEAL